MDTIDPTKYGLVMDATQHRVITTVPVDLPPLPHDFSSLERIYVGGIEFGYLTCSSAGYWEVLDGMPNADDVSVLSLTDTRANAIAFVRDTYENNDPQEVMIQPDLT